MKPAHNDSAWRVRISDNGLGVAAEQREKAFQMFRRLHPDDGLAGAGAGLAIARRIARRHGGDVAFVRRDPPGACVELWLPQARTTH